MKITDLNPDVLGMVRDKRALTRLKIRSGADIEALDWTKIFKQGPILLRKTKTRGPLRVTSIHDFEGNDYLKDKVVKVVSRKKKKSGPAPYDMVVDIYDPQEPEFPERSKIGVNSSMVFFEAPRSSSSASKKKRRSRKKAKKTKRTRRPKRTRTKRSRRSST
jgi:hypothetical protein